MTLVISAIACPETLDHDPQEHERAYVKRVVVACTAKGSKATK
jgi:hypothetical protein